MRDDGEELVLGTVRCLGALAEPRFARPCHNHVRDVLDDGEYPRRFTVWVAIGMVANVDEAVAHLAAHVTKPERGFLENNWLSTRVHTVEVRQVVADLIVSERLAQRQPVDVPPPHQSAI